jgi:hypothetical protein
VESNIVSGASQILCYLHRDSNFTGVVNKPFNRPDSIARAIPVVTKGVSKEASKKVLQDRRASLCASRDVKQKTGLRCLAVTRRKGRGPQKRGFALRARKIRGWANLLGGNFNRIDAGIIPHGHEVEEDLPLVIWNEAMEGLCQGSIFPSGLFEDVKVAEQHRAITIHIEQAAVQAASARIARAKESLREVERGRVCRTRGHRNGVTEVTEALAQIEVRVWRAFD